MEKYGKLDYSDFSKFEGKNYGSGLLTLTLTSWPQFEGVVKVFNNTDYIWRGERRYGKDWVLNSSFDRRFKILKANERQRKLDEIYDSFKRRLEALPNVKITGATEDEIWAIGQHYGLPTPLLDWTESPYIAAYMAFFKRSEADKTDFRAIYALNRALKRLLATTKQRFVEFPDLGNRLDEMQIERLRQQQAKFTKALNGDDIKVNIERFWGKRAYGQKIFLAEILIPDGLREECLEFLKSKNIAHGTLFPDYAGAVEICKMELGIDNCPRPSASSSSDGS